MLPGLRGLVATVAVAITIVIFGFGAAGLLRTAHEDFATLQTWRMESVPDSEPDMPRLAALRVEPEPDIAERAAPMIGGAMTNALLPEPPVLIALPVALPDLALPALKAEQPVAPVAVVAALAPSEPLPLLSTAAYNLPRTGPLLMPEIATNEALPVTVASLAPVEAETPLEFAPLPRQRPVAKAAVRSRIVKRHLKRRVAAIRSRPTTSRPVPNALEQLFGTSNQRTN